MNGALKSFHAKLLEGVLLRRQIREHLPRLSLKSRFLLGQIMPAIIALIIAFLVIFAVVQDRMVSTARKAALDVNQQVTNVVDYVWLMTLSQVYVLNNDSEIIRWLNSNPNQYSPLTEAAIQEKLVRAKESNPLIWSIYAYNASQDRFVTTYNRTVRLVDFPDRQIVAILTNPKGSARRFIPRRAVEVRSNRPVKINVITAVIPSDFPGSALIINISVDTKHQYDFAADSSLEQLLGTTLSSNRLGQLLVSDGDGTVFFDETSRRFGSKVTRVPYVTKIIGTPLPSGSFTSKINGRQCLVTFATSKYLGWKIINLIPYQTLLSGIYFLRNFILVALLLICLLVVLFALFYSGNMTRPVSTLVQQAREYLKDNLTAGGARVDEIGTVSRALNTVAAEAAALRLEARTTRSQLMEDLAKNLITGIPMRDTNAATYHDLSQLLSGNIIVTVIEPDLESRFAPQCEARHFAKVDVSDLLSRVKTIIATRIAPDFRHIAVITAPGQLAFAVSHGELPSVAFNEHFKEFCRDIQQQIAVEFGHSVTIGLGPVVATPEQLNHSFEGALDAVATRFKRGRGLIADQEGLKAETTDLDYPKELERFLLEGLRLGNLPQVTDCLQRFVTAVTPYADAEIVLAMSQLAFAAARVIDELDEARRSGLITNKRTLKKDLDNIQTLDDMSHYLIVWFQSSLERFDDNRSRRRLELVAKVKALVAEEFSNPDLTLQDIAAAICLSPSHLRALFREATGETLTDFIAEYRLQTAARLLIDTDKPVVAIAGAVGLSSANYFHNVFRRRFGVTPVEYRRGHRD